MIVNNRREQIGWYFYDWANSAFYTTVVTVFLGPYLTEVAKAAAQSLGEGNTFVYPLGIKVFYGSVFPYVVSLSVALQVLLLPILGALADYSHRKKQMLALFAYIGAFATMGLYFLQGTNYLLGGALFVVANLSFGASEAFYNSFLSDIAAPDDRDRVSSIGWAIGYLGGGILLALNLYLFSKADAFGLTTEHAVRISLASSGAWWAVFTLIPLSTLKNRLSAKSPSAGQSYVATGFNQLRHTIKSARHYPQTLLFLIAYLLYNDGIQAVIALAAVFGAEELKLEESTLVQVILMVQFVAFFGSLLFNWVSKATGGKRAIMISLVIWTGVLVYAYGLLQTKLQFFILGAVIAIVLGGSQALSRSVYSLMIPKGQEAEYFSLYEVSDKGTSWLAPLLFGLALQFTGSYRAAILSLVVFFIVGLALLVRVNVRAAAIEAGNEAPARA
ncbi:MAG TPA: MFS transporter [Blastocatellia bacterium]|nr:MFS transporter [Blastocatellia bacterium]